MSKPIITQCATTTHGGVVSEVLDTFTIDGKKIHLDGMQHYCPLCKKNVSAIGTDSTKNVMGKKMVFEDDKTTCGASFIANQGLAFADTGGAALGKDLLSQLTLNQPSHEFAQKFLLRSHTTDEIIRNGEYEVYKNGHLVLKGKTDENGMTQLISTIEDEEIEIRILSEGSNNG
ncbi:PAAR domain-containing protein [Acinetobacter puyangensis]|uniref:PAAR domain-containing protein n=1 Tax=Acinetobacter puyangensis TaxID=1096779 RepID=UPI003A4E45F2